MLPILASKMASFTVLLTGDEAARARLLYSLHAVMYGTVSMLDCGELENSEASFTMIRETVGDLLH